MTDSNFRTCIADTYALAFDGNLGMLIIPTLLPRRPSHMASARPCCATCATFKLPSTASLARTSGFSPGDRHA